MTRAMMVGVLMVSGVLAMSGCQRALFPPQAHRTQYERYALLRGRARPATQPDAYGFEKPALRERLRPLDEPN